jgi:hypothetical protein
MEYNHTDRQYYSADGYPLTVCASPLASMSKSSEGVLVSSLFVALSTRSTTILERTATRLTIPGDDCCLYHALIDFLDKWAEAHSPMNIDETIDLLITIAAEDIAIYPDAKVRKFVTNREMDKLAQRVREFRAQRRYPVPLPARSTEASDNDNHRDQAGMTAIASLATSGLPI